MTLYDRLDRAVSRGEALLGRPGFAVASSLCWMGVAALCVRPGQRAVELGVYYAQLSVDPLGFHPSPVGYRILTPLLSWAVGLSGESIRWTNLALATLLLCLVHLRFRRHAPRPADAPLAAGALALSLVTLSTVFSPTYCDPATYGVVFAMWWLRAHRPWVYVLFALGLFNRESIVFLLPWFVWLHVHEASRQDGAPSRARAARGALLGDALGFGVALAIYGAFRAFVASQSDVVFGLDYYLAPLADDPLHFFRKTLGRQWIGLYSVFGVLWVVPLGVAIAMWRRGDRSGPLSMAILLACTWAQLFVAYDTSRMLTLGFMVMVVALDDAFVRGGPWLRRALPWLLLAQVLVPQLRTAQQRVWVMESPWRQWLLGVFSG